METTFYLKTKVEPRPNSMAKEEFPCSTKCLRLNLKNQDQGTIKPLLNSDNTTGRSTNNCGKENEAKTDGTIWATERSLNDWYS